MYYGRVMIDYRTFIAFFMQLLQLNVIEERIDWNDCTVVLACIILVILGILLCVNFAVSTYHWVIYRRCPANGKSYDLKGKVYIVTGANSGIGRQVVTELFKRNAYVIGLARNLPAAIEMVRDTNFKYVTSSGRISVIRCDLTNLIDVRLAANVIMHDQSRVDGIVCNAGIGAPETRRLTRDRMEECLQANFVSHALFTKRLMPLLTKSRGVVVNVSSCIAERADPFDVNDLAYSEGKYSGFQAYCRSKKLINIHTKILASQFKDVTFYSVSPGIVHTPIGDQFVRCYSPRLLLPFVLPICRFGYWLIARTVKQGALTIWPLLVESGPPSGSYIDNFIDYPIESADEENLIVPDLNETIRMRRGLICGVLSSQFNNSPEVGAPELSVVHEKVETIIEEVAVEKPKKKTTSIVQTIRRAVSFRNGKKKKNES